MNRAMNPHAVLVLAILFPGAGHVAVGQAARGFCFLLFAVLFMVLSYLTTTPEHSFVGRHAGGFFIWALSITDAYRLARIRYETPRRGVARFSP